MLGSIDILNIKSCSLKDFILILVLSFPTFEAGQKFGSSKNSCYKYYIFVDISLKLNFPNDNILPPKE